MYCRLIISDCKKHISSGGTKFKKITPWTCSLVLYLCFTVYSVMLGSVVQLEWSQIKFLAVA